MIRAAVAISVITNSATSILSQIDVSIGDGDEVSDGLEAQTNTPRLIKTGQNPIASTVNL